MYNLYLPLNEFVATEFVTTTALLCNYFKKKKKKRKKTGVTDETFGR